jgi:PilZ domain-containing protein
VWDRLGHRHSPRYPIMVPIFYTPIDPTAAKAGIGQTCSLSEGGACLELATPVRPPAALRLMLQSEEGGFTLEAEVVWVSGPSVVGGGIPHGVAFTRVTRTQQQALRDFLSGRLGGRTSGSVATRPAARNRPTREVEVPIQLWPSD